MNEQINWTDIPPQYKIHALYLALIAVAIIIGLTTSKWGDNPKLVDYVNFTATLTSLILAILAIVYAFLSNTSISSSISKMEFAASEISGTATRVFQAADLLKDKVELIPERLDSMEEKFDQVVNVFSPASDTATANNSDAAGPIPTGKDFLDDLPLGAVQWVYIIAAADVTKKPFKFEEISEKAFAMDQKYGIAILLMLNATKLASFSGKKLTEIIIIKSLNKDIRQAALDGIDEFAERWLDRAKVTMTESAIESMRTKYKENIRIINEILDYKPTS